MIYQRVFRDKKAKEADVNFLQGLKTKSEDSFRKDVAINWESIDDFIKGNQWKSFQIRKDGLSFNNAGDVVYNFDDTFKSYNGNSPTSKPKRTVNLTKSTIDSFVSIFAEVDPIPMAISRSDYVYDENLVHKINLLLKEIFRKENDGVALYKLLTEKSLTYGHSFAQIKIDIDHSDSTIPIRILFINPRNIFVDPQAITVDEADYVIQTVKMKYYEMKQIFDWKEEIKLSDPDDFDDIELDYYWIRFKDTENIVPITKWRLVPCYGNKQLDFKKAKDLKDINVVELYVYDTLPLQIFKGKIKERWFGESLALEVIPFNVEYNKVVSENDWNWLKTIDKPIYSKNVEPKKVEMGQVPGGIIDIGDKGQIVEQQVALIGSGEFEMRKQSIKNEMAELVGNVDVIQGRRPAGVYSDKMLQTIQKAGQLKPKMWEEEFLKNYSLLAEKSLKILAQYMGDGSVVIYDPDAGQNITITADDINNVLYQVDVQTKDDNLITREAKFEIIRDIMQYSPVMSERFPYYIMKMVNNAIPNLVPNEIIDELKKTQKNMEENLSNQVPQNTLPKETGQMQGSETMPPAEVPQENEIIEMTDDEYVNLITEQVQRMKDAGYDQKFIDKNIETAIIQEEKDGIPKEEIVINFQALVDKYVNIQNTNK